MSDIPKCAACDNWADPRFYARHPESGVSLMVCDGCWEPRNASEHDHERLREAILLKERNTSGSQLSFRFISPEVVLYVMES